MKSATPFTSLTLTIALAWSALTLAPGLALAGKSPPSPFVGAYCDEFGAWQLTVSKSGAVNGSYATFRVSGEVSADGVIELTVTGSTSSCLFDCVGGKRSKQRISVHAAALVEFDGDGNLIGVLIWETGLAEPLFLVPCD